MNSKAIYAIVAVAIIAIAAVAVFALMGNGGEKDVDHTGNSFADTRLRIYGNANGDDVIDKTDVGIINWIVSSNADSDASKHVDWKNLYPLADANYDGRVTDSDAKVVQDIIDKKNVRMYYFNKYERVTYVNYPISDKIGAEYLVMQLLPAIKSYDMLKAVDDTTPANYNNIYPGVDKMPVMGTGASSGPSCSGPAARTSTTSGTRPSSPGSRTRCPSSSSPARGPTSSRASWSSPACSETRASPTTTRRGTTRP